MMHPRISDWSAGGLVNRRHVRDPRCFCFFVMPLCQGVLSKREQEPVSRSRSAVRLIPEEHSSILYSGVRTHTSQPSTADASSRDPVSTFDKDRGGRVNYLR